jgi:ferric-chelate reductase
MISFTLMLVNSMQEEGNVHNMTMNSSAPSPKSDGCSSMSVLVGAGNNIFSGLYLILSTLGFVLIIGLLDIFYIKPFGISTRWYTGLLFLICMPASVFIFGGPVVGIWHLWGRNETCREECEDNRHNEAAAQKDRSSHTNLPSSTNTYYGSRPDFEGMSFNFMFTLQKTFTHFKKTLPKF